MNPLLPNKQELLKQFIDAQEGIDQKLILLVQKGLPTGRDGDPEIVSLRVAWSRYHNLLR